MGMLTTDDGRDLSREEWRVIPEFPKYQITSDGDVRNIRTGKLLVESVASNGTTYFYNIWKDLPGGKKKCFKRSYSSLLYDAFPELKPAPKVVEPKRSYIKRGLWRVVPGYPRIEVHESGAVRYKAGKRRIQPSTDVQGVEYVILRNSDGDKKWPIVVLQDIVYPKKGKLAA